jgi:hypothetical protein
MLQTKPLVIIVTMLQLKKRVAEERDFPLHSIQHGSETHPASYPMGTGFFSRGSGNDVKIYEQEERECF